MPHLKHVFSRLRIIDEKIRSKSEPFPSKADLRQACEEALFNSSNGENICNSTIEKDIFTLREEYDAPIQYSRMEKGYYYEDENYTIDKSPLSEKDIEALSVAATTLSQFKGMDFYQEYGFALDRIVERVKSGESGNGLTRDNKQEVIQFETGVGKSGQEYISLLITAIQQKKEVWFDYASFASDDLKKRKVCPLLLKEYRNRWYLICYDVVKEKTITYGLDRMTNLEVSDLKAQYPTHFNPDLYFKHAVGITVNSENPEKVQLRANDISSKYLVSQPLHESQKIIKREEKFTLFEYDVLVTEELIRAILSYGGEMEVIAPTSLRKTIENRAKSLVALYKNA